MMNSPAVPWKVLSSQASFSVLSEGWNLAETDSDENRVRCFTVQVSFDAAFLSVPVIQLGITGFDIDQRDSARLTVKAGAITEHGFEAILSTWANTRVYAVDFNWFAIGS